ncbi:MAG TPA: XRE family transcriptional regulator [Terriglobia bacterium]|nr:XRE family transcriptional regulator [Terriglobia bacterium]
MKLRSQSSDELKEMFNPNRFALARRRRGLKKTELASAIGVSLKSIMKYESGDAPSPETMLRIVEILKFPEEFFFGDDLEEIDASAVSFRSMARMPASRRDEALGQGAMCVLLNQWLVNRFGMPKPVIPNLRLATPEAAAMIVRTEWGLGVQPISNMIHLLESKGVRVFSLSVKAREVDAFSMWKDETPFVMLNVQKSSEHSRFDAAHELAHLVLHRQGAPTGKEAETEANRFASAFLMPDADVLAHIAPNPSISALLKWKKRWKVSLAALNYRLHQLSMTTEYHYRQLCIVISNMGARTNEIDGVARETSLLMAKVLKMLADDGVSRAQVAADLSITSEELDAMMFGLTITALPGGRPNRNVTMPSLRSSLSLVPSPTTK